MVEIDESHFYQFHTEFREYLLEYKHVFFEDLNTEELKNLFQSEFIAVWNDGRLPKKYYDGLLTEERARHPLVNFKWNLKQNENADLRSIDSPAISSKQSKSQPNNTDFLKEKQVKSKIIGPALPPEDVLDQYHMHMSDQADAEEEEKMRKKRHDDASRKRYKEQHELTMEELVPRKEGRAAQIEKRRMKANVTKREASPEAALEDKTIYESDSFAAALARRRAHETRVTEGRNRKQNEKQAVISQRMQAHATREEELMASFRAMAEKNQHIYHKEP